MPFLLCLVFFVPMILALAFFAKKDLFSATPALFLGLCLSFYILGLLSLLGFATWLFYAFWLLCLVYCLFYIVRLLTQKNKQVFLSIMQNNLLGLLFFVFYAALLWWACRGVRYATWDEFSHWGRALKAVFGQKVLPAIALGEDNFKDYPPGLAPLQASLLWALRMGFREDVSLYIQGLFSASLLLYPLCLFEKKNLLFAPISAMLLFFCPSVFFWGFYQQTMVDGFLGVLFGFALAVHFLGKNGKFEKILQCMALAMLPLVKSSGLFFAIVAMAIIIADDFYKFKKLFKNNTTVKATLIAPILSILVASGSWQIFLRLKNVPRRWVTSSFSLKNFFGLFTGSAPAWQMQTASSYFSSIFLEANYGWPKAFLPFVGVLGVFALAFLFLRRLLLPKNRKSWDIGFWGLFFSSFVYVLGLLFSYLYSFSQYEAVRLASLSRYLNTYLVSLLLFLLSLLVFATAKTGKKPFTLACAFLASCLAWAALGQPNAILGPFVNAPQHAVSTSANAQQYTDAAATIANAKTIDGVARVYVVAQDDLGATTLRLGYELFPTVLPQHISSIGPNYEEDDLLSLRINKNEWAQLLQKEYDYVYIYMLDDAFIAEFAPLFESTLAIGQKRLYRVVKTGTNVALKPV